MKLVIVSVRDRALEAFGRPVFTQSRGVAVRSFSDEVNRADSEMAKHPDDYDMYCLGEFDDSTGRFVAPELPELLARASTVLVKS